MIEVVPESDVGRSTHVAILRLWMRMSTDPQLWVDEARTLAAGAISAFREVGDERGLARGWSLLGLVHIMNARFGPAEHAWRKAAAHAHRAGDRREELESLAWVPIMICAGPAHTDVGLRQCGQVLESVEGDNKAMAGVCTAQAMFVAGLGRFDESRMLIGQAKSLLGAGADGLAGRPGCPVRGVDRAARGRSGGGRAGAPLRPRHAARDRRGGLALDRGGDPGRGRVPAGPRRRGRPPDARERAVRRRRRRLLAGRVAQRSGQGAGTPRQR